MNVQASNEFSFEDWLPSISNAIRVFAAVVLGYLLITVLSVFVGQLLQKFSMDASIAVPIALMASFVLYVVLVVWMYHTKSLTKVLLWMVGGIIISSIGSWALMTLSSSALLSLGLTLLFMLSTAQLWMSAALLKKANNLADSNIASAQNSQFMPSVAAGAELPLTILFGSQTGNAEEVAEDAANTARAYGLKPTVLDMDDVDVKQLSDTERLLVVTSTYGEGEMPDNAQELWNAVSENDELQLDNTHFSVFALGDSSYTDFCMAGKEWDTRLEQLGAQRIVDRVECDVEFEEQAQSWINQVIPSLAGKGSGSNGSNVVPIAGHLAASSAVKAKSKHNRSNPLETTLTVKKTLSQPGSSKEILHYELSLAGTSATYNAGDALNIIPQNRAELVTELLHNFDANADDDIIWNGHKQQLSSLLTDKLEIRMPSKELVIELAKRNGNEELNRLLVNDDAEALTDFLWGKDCMDLLNNYACDLNIENFCALCKPLAARAYSISSSLNAHPEEVHLTVSNVRYQSNDRDHNGVASTFLADIVEQGTQVKAFFSPNKNFAVPADNDLPMIMVGPGTGVAPFRAFLEERQARGANGDNWLFFGDRNRDTDFIYQDEIEAMQTSGLLTRLDLAFSRDQVEKIYVQDRMLENGAELFKWLENGGYFYVCGDAFRMAKDVDNALFEVISEHGQLNDADAKAYVSNLKKQKRYVRDVY